MLLNLGGGAFHINEVILAMYRNGFSRRAVIATIDKLGDLGLIKSVGAGHCITLTEKGRWNLASGNSAGVHDGEAG